MQTTYWFYATDGWTQINRASYERIRNHGGRVITGPPCPETRYTGRVNDYVELGRQCRDKLFRQRERRMLRGAG